MYCKFLVIAYKNRINITLLSLKSYIATTLTPWWLILLQGGENHTKTKQPCQRPLYRRGTGLFQEIGGAYRAIGGRISPPGSEGHCPQGFPARRLLQDDAAALSCGKCLEPNCAESPCAKCHGCAAVR